MTIYYTSLFKSIRAKITLFIAAIILLIILMFGLLVIKYQEFEINQGTLTQARSIGTLAQSTINRMLRHGNSRFISELLAELHVSQNTRVAVVVDNSAKVIYAYRKNYINKPLEDLIAGTDIQTISLTIRTELSQFPYLAGERKYISYIPIFAGTDKEMIPKNYVLVIEYPLAKRWYHVANQRLIDILLITTILLIFGAISWFYINNLITRRLNYLTDAVNKIAQGEKVENIEVTGDDEIAHVTRAIEEMSVERYNNEIELHKLSSAVNQSWDSIVITNLNAEIEYVNDAFLKSTGYSNAEVLGKNPKILQSGKTPRISFENMWATLLKGEVWIGELWNKRKDGFEYIELATITPIFNHEDKISFYLAIKKDITTQKTLEIAQKKTTKTLDSFFNLHLNIHLIAGFDGSIIRTNPGWMNTLGYEKSELKGKTFIELVHPDDRQNTLDEMEKLAQGVTTFYFENRYQHKNGTYRLFAWSAIASLDDKIIYAIATDITERKAAEENLHQLAYYDQLTTLANKLYILERLDRYLGEDNKKKQYGVLFVIDLDNFQHINDARGYEYGDTLLKELAQRLSQSMSHDCICGRAGNDVFLGLTALIYLSYGEACRYANSIAQSILALSDNPCVAFGEELSFSLSIGSCIFSAPQDTTQNIMQQAETALHHAKNLGGNQHYNYEKSIGEKIQRKFEVERELRRALVNNELCMYVQPQVNYQGDIKGVEALVRWQHPEKGLVMPGAFVPIAEESDIIIDLDNFMLAKALEFIAKNDALGKSITISVNVSPQHFRKLGFVPWLSDAISTYGADPNHLILEVTEGLAIEGITETINKMNQLRSMGIRFSIDDFGTGYSSLSYLKRLPVNELKIDRSFIKDLPDDKNDEDLVKTILMVAKSLGLQVVAEGVETQQQADLLNSYMEISYQGYLYAKPQPVGSWLN